MKTSVASFALVALALASTSPADAKGCLKGAVVGRRRRSLCRPSWRARCGRRLYLWPPPRQGAGAPAAGPGSGAGIGPGREDVILLSAVCVVPADAGIHNHWCSS